MKLLGLKGAHMSNLSLLFHLPSGDGETHSDMHTSEKGSPGQLGNASLGDAHNFLTWTSI